jgi:hypothetical protein
LVCNENHTEEPMLIFMFFLSNGHSPQICENGELLVRMCRGESHFSQKRPFGKCRRVWRVRENRLANVSESGESGKIGWRMSTNLVGPSKTGWRMSTNLVSPTYFPKRPFWRVLEFDKNGEFPASTRIRQIHCRVAIA